MALARSFKLAFQVFLTGCSYTYRLSNRNLFFQYSVSILLPYIPIDLDQDKPSNGTAKVDFYEKKMTTYSST